MDQKYFEDMKVQIKEFQARMEKEGKDLFLQMSKSLFEENPTLVKFGWHQYTPYFNDGDECVFSADLGDPHILLEGQDEDLYDEQEYFSDSEKSDEANVWRNVRTFLEQFSDDDVEMFFGDHVEVIVKRDGVEVQEYSHD
jgi:hypothetical protein